MKTLLASMKSRLLFAAAICLAGVAHGQSSRTPSHQVQPDRPQAMVQTIYAFGDSAARAEIVADGRVFTVQVGDDLQGWTVSAINPSGVVVTINRLQADPLTTKGSSIGARQDARERASWFAPVRPVAGAKPGMVEFSQTFMLPSAKSSAAIGSTRGPTSAISIQ